MTLEESRTLKKGDKLVSPGINRLWTFEKFDADPQYIHLSDLPAPGPWSISVFEIHVPTKFNKKLEEILE